jgi:hypothetical protein
MSQLKPLFIAIILIICLVLVIAGYFCVLIGVADNHREICTDPLQLMTNGVILTYIGGIPWCIYLWKLTNANKRKNSEET